MTNTTTMEVEPRNTQHLSAMRDIPLSAIQESQTNPRRRFDETQLAELAENIRLHGVLQPVLVRPLPGGDTGSYELVAGARRYRASQPFLPRFGNSRTPNALKPMPIGDSTLALGGTLLLQLCRPRNQSRRGLRIPRPQGISASRPALCIDTRNRKELSIASWQTGLSTVVPRSIVSKKIRFAPLDGHARAI